MSENPKYKENIIMKLTFEFSLEIIEFTEYLESQKKFNLSKQLFRSGTGIGYSVVEAQNAESKADFIHKLKIAMKECDETEYWLLLCKHAKNYPDPKSILEKRSVISKVLNRIISTSKSQKKSNSLNKN
jgi:four helix bundle protein